MAAASLRLLVAALSARLAAERDTLDFLPLVVLVVFLREDDFPAVEFAFVFIFLSFTLPPSYFVLLTSPFVLDVSGCHVVTQSGFLFSGGVFGGCNHPPPTSVTRVIGFDGSAALLGLELPISAVIPRSLFKGPFGDRR